MGYNIFAYCGNDPVNKSDNSGNWPRRITKAVADIAFLTGRVFKSGTARLIATLAYRAYDYQTYHFDVRKELNQGVAPLNIKAAELLKWEEQPEQNARCHQFTAEHGDNIKYLSPDGHQEVVFNNEGAIVMDSRDIGTYNFYPYDGTMKGALMHFRYDILPWIIFGNDDSDPGPIINYAVKIFS